MIATGSVQEVMILHRFLIFQQLNQDFPLSFFDGFRTSHEVQKIEVKDYKELADLVDL